MENYRVNTNYAKALFLVAGDTDQLDAVNDDMRLVADTCAENHILSTVFANPVIPEHRKMAVLQDLFAARVSKVSMLFMDFVVRKRRSVNLRGIANAFVQLYRDHKGIVLSHLVTATPASEEVKKAVCQKVGAVTNKTVELETEVDPSILGGMSIAFDGNMYDARISTAVAELRREFSKNVYESKL
ncbi:MAG: ATP synthase F1 subunit delta [Bacteroidales bacterium]|nr:ATP synthase F1 subunit delta [Bacteroidales bacterium]